MRWRSSGSRPDIAGVCARPRRPCACRPASLQRADETALVDLLAALAGRRHVTLVVVARDEDQRRRLLAPGLPGVLVPGGPVDGVGLLAAADFVVGHGGVMLREAAALGTPAYTLSPSAGPVEASLLGDGRLKRVSAAGDIALHKKDTRTTTALPRDPWLFADRLLDLARRRSRRARLGRLIQDATDEPPRTV